MNVHEELARAIPIEVIEDKDGLSYIPGWWVVSEMNRIFGPLAWSRRTIEAHVVPGPEGGAFHAFVNRQGKTSNVVHAHATVAVDIHLPEGVITRQASAGGTGRGADPLRDAIGEAETDAFKRAAATLGPRLGLELYIPHIIAVDRLEAAAREEDDDTALALANAGDAAWARRKQGKTSEALRRRQEELDATLRKRFAPS